MTAASIFRSHQTLRNIVSFAYDLLTAAFSFLAAYVTVYGYPQVLDVPALDEKLLGFVASAVAAFVIFAPYRGSWRYASIPDMMSIIKGAGTAVVIYMVGAFLMTRGQNVPRSVPILTLAYMVPLQAGARLFYRVAAERLRQRGGRIVLGMSRDVPSVLLCGLSDKAESFIRATRRSRAFAIAGIIDDSHINLGRTIQGVRVLGTLDDLERLLRKLATSGHPVSELVVTEVTPSRRRLAHIVGRGNACALTVSRIPDILEVSTLSSDQLLQPKLIELGDLLDRPEVTSDLESVARLVEGKVVLATGAAGSIGAELCRQIAQLGPSRLILVDNSEYMLYRCDTELRDRHPDLALVSRLLDVRDASRVAGIFAEFSPDIVFHAAALKHVPMLQDNPLEAIKTNFLGTRNVADAALANRASTFVMISTDKAVNPTSIMGATKRAAETYCQALDLQSRHTRFRTVRFGNVLGSNGSVVPRFQQQIAAGGPVTVTHPHIVRYFMTIPEAVRLVLHASAHALTRKTPRGKIMVLDMGKPVRIVDMAERMIQLAGLRPYVDIEIAFTGLRAGEKLFEELLDPSEVPDGRTEEGYVIDRQLLNRTISEIVLCAGREDETRALELLSHIVPEFHGEPDEPDERGVHAMPAMPVRTPSRPNDKGPSATGSG
jgi:O-antigen biosynthesis protein WbqV